MTMGEGARVRDAEPVDAPEIAAMIGELAAYENSVADLSFTVDRLRSALAGNAPPLRAILAEDREGTVGFITYTIDFAIWTGGEVFRVDDVFVRQRARGQGIGGRMMAELARRAIGAGVSARWEIKPDNLAAQRFYSAHGVSISNKMVARWSLDAMRSYLDRPR